MKLVLNRNSDSNISTVMNIEGNTLYIYDYIEKPYNFFNENKPDPNSIDSEQFLSSIRNMTGDIEVRINSQGGEVGYSLSIYQTLMEHKGKVTTVVDGYAYSAASWVLLAGEDREIMPGGVVMTHNPIIYARLDSEDSFNSTLQQWKVNRDSVAEITASRTGMTKEVVHDMMEKQTFMNANEAIKNGFCTKIREGKASIPKGVGNYLPSAIRNAVPEVINVDYNDLLTKTALYRAKKLANR